MITPWAHKCLAVGIGDFVEIPTLKVLKYKADIVFICKSLKKMHDEGTLNLI